jgi:hypothetical protein
VHYLPEWGALIDPFPDGAPNGVSAFSWLVVTLEIAGALGMGLIGFVIVRRGYEATA